MSQTVFFVRSQLLSNSNSKFPTLRAKLFKVSTFLRVSQNSDLSSQLNPTHQHDSKGILSFQNRALSVKLLKFHANIDERTYIEKCDFQWNVFVKFETAIGFVASKRVQRWSQIFILSPNQSYTQNETTLNWQFLQFYRKI